MAIDPTLFVYYTSPTTPTAASFVVDMTSAIRLGSISGLTGEAEMGAVGEGNIVFDDPSSSVGHLSDGIVGLKQMAFVENACPVGNRRLYSAYIGDRRYHRGDTEPSGTASSLITGSARKIDVTLVDLNSFLSFRVFAPTADDPTSDFNRPAETDLARIAAMLTTVDFLSTTLFDIGYIPTTGGVALDANDYTGQRPVDVLNDCAQASGRNFFVLYDEASGHLVLWYDTFDTDGSATKTYDSPLRLTNVLAEHDGIGTFAVDYNAVEVLDPSRVISATYVPYNPPDSTTNPAAYRTLASTANTFAWRDSIAPSVSVKTLAKAQALGDRYLLENSTEASRISCTVQLPRAVVTGIHEGMRLQAHFTHLPSVSDGFTMTRVLQRTIRQDVETPQYWWLDLELTPIETCIIQSGTETFRGGCLLFEWDAQPSDDNLLISFLAQRGGSDHDATIVPIGNTQGLGVCSVPDDVPGTGWTYINGYETSGAPCGFAGYPVTAAWRQAVDPEPPHVRWGGTGGGLAGSAGPRAHYVEVSCDMAGAPSVQATSALQTTGGSVFASPSIAATGAGYIFWGMSYSAPGPADGFSAAFVMTPRAPAVKLSDGYAFGDFAPYSCFGYLKVAGAGSYTVTLDRSAVPRDPDRCYGWWMGFWAT